MANAQAVQKVEINPNDNKKKSKKSKKKVKDIPKDDITGTTTETPASPAPTEPKKSAKSDTPAQDKTNTSNMPNTKKGKNKRKREQKPQVEEPTEAALDEAIQKLAHPDFDLKQLEQRLLTSSKFFDNCVNLIPAAHYFTQTPEEELERASKYDQNKKEKAPKQEIKEATKKAKRARLDPSSHKTVVDIQIEKKIEMDDANNDDDEEEEEEHQVADIDLGDDVEMELGDVATGAPITKTVTTPSSFIEEVDRSTLKTRLATKINSLKGNRKERMKTVGTKVGSKKKQAKMKAEKARLKIKQQNAPGSEPNAAARAPLIQGTKNSSGAVVFSKFDFSTAQRVEHLKKKGPSTPMQLLAKAKADQERLEKLKKKDPEAAEKKEQSKKLKAALLKTEGVKVKDDPTLLKKTVERTETKKRKSTRDWDQRKETIDKYKDEKDKKRKINIKTRKDAKIEKKLNRGKKSAKTSQKGGKTSGKGANPKKRPGFEGSTKKPSSKGGKPSSNKGKQGK
eukprot:m.258380 g.258380  ORF g.258380 m.258380 type:complete len:509 (-) comp36493_c0_seq1:186-1712(-)